MLKALLKALIVSFGGGLALGAGMKLGRSATGPKDEPGIDLNPLLNRLDGFEERVATVEAAMMSPETRSVRREGSPSILGTLKAQQAQVEGLRDQIQRIEQRSSDQVLELEKKVGELEVSLPAAVESGLIVRVQEVEKRLQQDLAEAHNRATQSFMEAIQTKVVQRISSLENSLTEQSEAIGNLREASVKTDHNLQKMLLELEKLVEQRSSPTVGRAAEMRRAEGPASSSIPASRAATAVQQEPGTQPFNGAAAAAAVETTEDIRQVVANLSYNPADPLGLKPGVSQTRPQARWGLALLVCSVVGALILLAWLVVTRMQGKQEQAARSTTTVSTVSPNEENEIPPGDIQKLKTLVAHRPNDKNLLLRLGNEYELRKDWPRAEESYRSVLRIDPNNRDALLALSNALYQQQKYGESAAIIGRLSSGSP